MTASTAKTASGDVARLVKAPVGRLLWEYALPAVTGMAVMSLYNVIDRIFIGQGIHPNAIAGLAVTFPVMNLATALGVLIGAGSAARVSIMLGARRIDIAERILGNALVMTIVIGLIYVAGFAIFLDDILIAFGASENTLPYAHDFMAWLLPGLLLTNLSFSFNNIQRASGYPKRAMWTMIISALINLALAPIFIFGLELGIRGAALATDIAMVFTLVYVMWHFADRRSTLHFVRGTFRIDWHIIAGIISIGAAPALVNAAASMINMMVNNSLLHYGSDAAVGAAGIFTTYTSLIVVVILGICQGMQPIVGYNYGAGRYDRLNRAYSLSVWISTALCIVGCGIGLAFPELIARIFTSDSELIEVTAHGLRIAITAFAVVGFQIVSTNFFQSIGLAPQSIVLSLSRQVFFLIPLLLILPGYFGLNGVWMSFPISDLLATIVTTIMIGRRFRIINHMARQTSSAPQL